MNRDQFLVVFTDLDGTLLDHRTYAFDAARSTLDQLARDGVPVILCSSKTRAEIEHLRAQLSLPHPFISENGGAVFVPDGYFPFPHGAARRWPDYRVIEFGRPYHELVSALHTTAEAVRIPVAGFSDMTVEEVGRLCGLSLLQARLAKLREYDEPFQILDPSPRSRSRLLRILHRRGLRCTRSSRFEHLTGATDKGVAVAALRRLYERAVEEPIVTIGLGDSLSDLPLLRAVDIPIIVDNQDAAASDRLLRKVPTARLTNKQGPRGWAEAIDGALETLQVKAMPNWQHAAAG